MMLGWSRKLWIFSSRTNCTRKFSRTIRFFSITFSPTISPELLSRARYTLPNFPSPSRRITLKLSFDSPSRPFLNFGGDFVWLLRNEGNVRSDL